MDNSTDGVTLLAVFINDVLMEIQKMNVSQKDVENIIEGHDISNPYVHVPIKIYNDLCTWVEKNLGEQAIIQVGKNIGETVYPALIENGIIGADAKPIEIMEGLVIAAASMIKDHKERGWEIVSENKDSIVMKRTQTFNSKLQIGLLNGLVSKCALVKNIRVNYLKQVDKGDEYDEYIIQWEYI
jgi:hypothetical protein